MTYAIKCHPRFHEEKNGIATLQAVTPPAYRDITLAIALQNEDVLPHLRIRTGDGEEIDGDKLTPDLVTKLRDDGQNPMWYLRRSWLEEAFGRREKGDTPPSKSEDEAEVPKIPLESDTTVGNDKLMQMMKESIAELKQDKVDLKAQLTIKDTQITQTTERWKESNILTKDMHLRIEAMEKQMLQLLPESSKSDGEDEDDTDTVEAETVEIKNAEKGSPHPTKRERTSSSSKSRGKSTNKRKQKKTGTPKPQWYETPTLNRWASRFRRR